jgi:small redox-active disulfide protein 2
MEIKVLGPGCPRCKELKKRTAAVVAELGLSTDVEKVEDIQRMVSFGILSTPALVINGKVKCAGRVPSMDEIRTWIREAASAAPAGTE